MAQPLLGCRLQAVVVAVRSGRELRHGSESRIGRCAVREGRKAALACRLITIHLSGVGLVHRACAHILNPQIDRVADLVFQSEAPLDEIGRVQFSIRHGGNCHWLQTSIRIRKRRRAGKLAFRKARVEYLICGDGRIDGAAWYSGRDRGSSHGAQEATLEGLGVRRVHAH